MVFLGSYMPAVYMGLPAWITWIWFCWFIYLVLWHLVFLWFCWVYMLVLLDSYIYIYGYIYIRFLWVSLDYSSRLPGICWISWVLLQILYLPVFSMDSHFCLLPSAMGLDSALLGLTATLPRYIYAPRVQVSATHMPPVPACLGPACTRLLCRYRSAVGNMGAGATWVCTAACLYYIDLLLGVGLHHGSIYTADSAWRVPATWVGFCLPAGSPACLLLPGCLPLLWIPAPCLPGTGLGQLVSLLLPTNLMGVLPAWITAAFLYINGT